MLKPIKRLKSNPIVWVLTDERTGNNNQCIGVAEAMSVPFDIKAIDYENTARMPNFIRGRTFMGVAKSSRAELVAPWPDVVISAGRKLMPVARAIKRKSKGKALLLHMMNPGFPCYDVNLMAIPQHDDIPARLNVLLTKGAPNRVNKSILAEQSKIWAKRFKHLPKPHVAVLVGGDNNFGPFTTNHAKQLAKSVNHLLESCGGSALISTSRRTSPEAAEMVRETIKAPNYFYDVDSEDENPYFGFLSAADALVVGGDSVSMCSEACSTGKSVYIFKAHGMLSQKHLRFVRQLIAEGLAQDLNKNITFSETSYAPLNEAQRIADTAWNMLTERA
jgi:mitochondrial fission protein ELM1